MKISFIGGGVMAEAIISAIINKKLALPDEILVSDKIEARRKSLADKYRIKTTDSNKDTASYGNLVILAVKPQNLAELSLQIKGSIGKNSVLLSILAGMSVNKISTSLGHSLIIRAMPNTPAQINQGMTVWTATPNVSAEHKNLAAAILSAMGKQIFVDNEKYLDMATAVSGSGPAYFYYFLEALMEAAVEIGLPPDIARELVIETMIGSGNYLVESGKRPAELRQMVTSPGGTTAAALAKLDERQFKAIIAGAIGAAYIRAAELGR